MPNAPVAFDVAFWRSVPMFLTAALAIAGTADALPLPTGATPVRVAIVVMAIAAGTALTAALDRPGSRAYWQMALCTVLILMPIVALQASASRVPFVSIQRDSAGPLLWLTFAVCLTLLALWLFAARQASDAPENAALLFLPPALLAPAILGAAGSLDETSTLSMLGQSSLLAGVAILIGSLSPPNWRPVAGGVALGAQFLLLWALGQGPDIGQHAGFVVPASAALLITLTVLLTVLAPLGSLFSRRFFQTVDDETGGTKPASVPVKGARRRIRA